MREEDRVSEARDIDVKAKGTWKVWIENIGAGFMAVALLVIPVSSAYVAITRNDHLMLGVFLVSALLDFFVYMRLVERCHGMR